MTTVVTDVVLRKVYADTKITLHNGCSNIIKLFPVYKDNITVIADDNTYNVLCFGISGSVSPTTYQSVNGINNVELTAWVKENLVVSPSDNTTTYRLSGVCLDGVGVCRTFSVGATDKLYSSVTICDVPVGYGSGGDMVDALNYYFDLNPRSSLLLSLYLGLDRHTGGMLTEVSGDSGVVNVYPIAELGDEIRNIRAKVNSLFEPREKE